MRIDLNSDVGEGFGVYSLGHDGELMRYITSINLACGFHAGDPRLIRKTITLAKELNVKVGAHPGFPDLIGFGRREMHLEPEEIRDLLVYQIGAIMAFSQAVGIKIQHVKPHGALYNMAARDLELARAVAAACAEVDRNLILVGLHGSALVKAGRELSLKVAQEAFLDRAYKDDGSLVPRNIPGSVITDPEEIIRRAVSIAQGQVTTITGKTMRISAETICLHSDTPGVTALAKLVRDGLEAAGARLTPMEEVLAGKEDNNSLVNLTRIGLSI